MDSSNPRKHKPSPSQEPMKKIKKTEDMEEVKGEELEFEDEYEDVYGIL